MRLAYLGPEGTYSHEAALTAIKSLQGEIELVPQPSLTSVVDAVEKQICSYAVLPVENSSNGPVVAALEALVDSSPSKVFVRGEVQVQVLHRLYTQIPNRVQIKRIYSHPQVWGQVTKWLKEHIPSAALIDSDSTSQALRHSLQDPESAAISSRFAGELMGVKAAEQNYINDNDDNTTRFLVLSADHPTNNDCPTVVTTNNTTTICVTGEGAVSAVILGCGSNGLCVRFMWLRSLGHWKYQVLVEIASPPSNEVLTSMINQLAKKHDVRRFGDFNSNTANA